MEKLSMLPGRFNLPVKLLERFSGDNVHMNEVLRALKTGKPSEQQVDSALIEIETLINRQYKHIRGPQKEVPSESELAELKKAKDILYQTLILLNPRRSQRWEPR